MRSDRGSRTRATLIESFPDASQVQRVWMERLPSGGDCRNREAMNTATRADRPTDPLPMSATALLGKRLPARARTTKPAKGRAGIRKRRSNMINSEFKTQHSIFKMSHKHEARNVLLILS
jgi:hypothetical protein